MAISSLLYVIISTNMHYYTTKASFLMAATLMSMMNFLFIVLIYSMHYLVAKIIIDIILVAVSLMFQKRIYAILLLVAFMLLEVFCVLRIRDFGLVLCVCSGFCFFPKLVGYLVAYEKK